MNKAFTLIELIVVIIIVGILAAVGMTQYSKMVEKGRGAEARECLGLIRQRGTEYFLQNGTFVGITSAELGIGSGADQLPGPTNASCRSTHYFAYHWWQGSGLLEIWASRCTSGGKSPQGPDSNGINMTIGSDLGVTQLWKCITEGGSWTTGCAY